MGDRPTPVINRALVASIVQLAVGWIGLSLTVQVQDAVIDALVTYGIPALIALVTYVQAKLAEGKVTPVSDPVVPDGTNVKIRNRVTGSVREEYLSTQSPRGPPPPPAER